MGAISNINPKANTILNIKDDYTGKKYISLIDDDSNKNDEFHQMLIDVVVDKKIVHKKRIKYNTAYSQKTLYIASSMLKDEDDKQIGAILSFDDVTKEETLKKKISNSALMFIILVALLSLWMFACAIFINDTEPINTTLFGRIIMYFPLVFTPVVVKVCGFTKNNLGLSTKRLKKNVIIDSTFTVIAVMIMCLVKIVLLKCVPSFTFYTVNNQFFDFTKYTLLARLEYLVCVISQEYLSRGLVYESIRRIVQTENNEKYVDAIAIVVSSLYFAALHIYLGPRYMIGAFVLLSLFGIIYKKQRSIWGLCIPHFVLGIMIEVLGFTMY